MYPRVNIHLTRDIIIRKVEDTMYIFLSHSSTNANIAETLCSNIEANGHQCFIAPRDIRTGFEYAGEILNGIDKSDVMILILSNASANSPHVLREIERAVSKSIPIIVYKLEDVVLTKSLEYFLMTHQWMNANNDNCDELINSINTLQVMLESSTNGDESNKPTDNTTSKNTPKRKRSVLPLVIFISAIVISISILTGTFILKGDKNNKSTDNTSSNIQCNDYTTTDSTTTDSNTTSNTDNNTEDETTTIIPREPIKVNIGDTLIFGKYNGQDIKWRVLRLSEDGREAILITDSIITIKGYDAADTGQYGYYNGESQYSSDK